MATKKKTGLGADAIFGGKQAPAQPTPPQPQPEPAAPPSIDKVRTTVMLAPDVLILLNRLKEKSILDGNRQTQGELMEEAIRLLAKDKGIKA